MRLLKTRPWPRRYSTKTVSGELRYGLPLFQIVLLAQLHFIYVQPDPLCIVTPEDPSYRKMDDISKRTGGQTFYLRNRTRVYDVGGCPDFIQLFHFSSSRTT